MNDTPSSDVIFHHPLDSSFNLLSRHPYCSALLLLLSVCLVTRITTGLQASRHLGEGASKPRSPPVVPYWLPWLGHIVPFIRRPQEWLSIIVTKRPASALQILIGGTRHNMIIAPSLAQQIYTNHRLPISTDQLVFYLLETVFGDSGATRKWDAESPGVAWGGPHRALAGMLHEPFLSKAVAATVSGLEERTLNLISGNASWVDQSVWERSAHVGVVEKSPDGSLVAEASLQPLLRDFLADLATRILMGGAFLDNNPTFLADVWTHDASFNLLLSGLPRVVVPGLTAATLARNRLVEAVREHHAALFAVLDGRDPGYRYADLGDVSPVMWERMREFRKANAPEDASTDYVITWALNVNSGPLMFWLVYYVHAVPGLLDEVRREVAPYVRVDTPEDNGLPFKDPPRLKLDGHGIVRKCPLVKGVLYETMRLVASGVSYRAIHEDFVLTESVADANQAGRTTAESYLFKKGDYACVPLWVHSNDRRYFPEPATFDPRRSWVRSNDPQTGEETIKIDIGTMRPWGGGKTMCKGRHFAEQEMLLFLAAVITCWDFEPVGGKWNHPGIKHTAATYNPKRDVRVRVKKRKL